MKKLSKKIIDLLNAISNARYRMGFKYEDECLSMEERQRAFQTFLALGAVEWELYDIAGITYEEFLQNNYRKIDGSKRG